jgi:replication fork clamp-binding protein CrfC
MKKIDISLIEFLNTVTSDFNGLIQKVVLMKENMDQIKREGTRSTQELHLARERHQMNHPVEQ